MDDLAKIKTMLEQPLNEQFIPPEIDLKPFVEAGIVEKHQIHNHAEIFFKNKTADELTALNLKMKAEALQLEIEQMKERCHGDVDQSNKEHIDVNAFFLINYRDCTFITT